MLSLVCSYRTQLYCVLRPCSRSKKNSRDAATFNIGAIKVPTQDPATCKPDLRRKHEGCITNQTQLYWSSHVFMCGDPKHNFNQNPSVGRSPSPCTGIAMHIHQVSSLDLAQSQGCREEKRETEMDHFSRWENFNRLRRRRVVTALQCFRVGPCLLPFVGIIITVPLERAFETLQKKESRTRASGRPTTHTAV